MFVEWYVLVFFICLILILFRLFSAMNILNQKVEKLVTKIKQLEHHAPNNLQDFDTPLVNRLIDLEKEVFNQTHPNIDYDDPKRIRERLLDLEQRVDSAGRWLREENLDLLDDVGEQNYSSNDDVTRLTKVVMSAGYQLRKNKNQ